MSLNFSFLDLPFFLQTKSDSSDISQRLSDETPTKPNRPIGRVSDSVNSGIVGNTPTIKSKRHKLSLCKDTNDSMTRKRLRSQERTSPEKSKKLKLEPDSELFNKRCDEPKVTTKNENCDRKATSEEAGEKVNSDPSTAALLQEEIDRIKRRITMTEKYQQQISDLQDLIKKWKSAGLKTIEEIQEKIQPTEVSDILRHFNIEPELFELNTTE